ncbi:MAG: hypothetical protein K2N58_11720 [Treponemataceae bacterium]|nr:hypothetical protein [Treponemataceae bacterium]
MIDEEELLKIDSNCIKYSKNEEYIVFSENGKKYTAQNEKRKKVLGFKVDGGYIKENRTRDKKCDYSLIVNDEICYLIELKETDISSACEQLLKTIESMLKKHSDMDKFLCRSIHSRINTHKIENENIKGLRKKLKKINKKFYNPKKSYIYKESKWEEII